MFVPIRQALSFDRPPFSPLASRLLGLRFSPSASRAVISFWLVVPLLRTVAQETDHQAPSLLLSFSVWLSTERDVRCMRRVLGLAPSPHPQSQPVGLVTLRSRSPPPRMLWRQEPADVVLSAPWSPPLVGVF